MKNSFWLFGSHHYILAEDNQTEKNYDLVEKRSAPGVETPLHIHNGYSELVYVLAGQLTVYTKSGAVILDPGSRFVIPRGTIHSLAATASEMTVSLQIFAPGGFAQLLRTVGTPGPKNNKPNEIPVDKELFDSWCEKLGDITIAPPGTRPEMI
jgi:quercetin dioxygenase-like cupin family protein